ncbi:bestrophin family protein [Mucilaginibacter sp. L196]|uniref:bestrophin family protein n=1 Tax=Mucilaginibacter sp. L196 TaxID=1641870 RepID=UPI00131AF67D|nr:bestrophin family ion channel [Mucilaginibacter sp. L196]
MLVDVKNPIGGLVIFTKRLILWFLAWSTLVVLGYEVFDLKFLTIPFLPISLIGTALSFYLGFKNNASYDRLWEARKNYGGIENDSRAFAAMLNTYIAVKSGSGVSANKIQQIKLDLIKRHIAWLYAHKFYLRHKVQPWEHRKTLNNEYRKRYQNDYQADHKLEKELERYISDEETNQVIHSANPAAQLLNNQSKKIKELMDEAFIDDLRLTELQNQIRQFFVHQGNNERIKNFPYPLQFSFMVSATVKIFCWLLPLGLLGEMSKQGVIFIWFTIPFSALISWVFFIMEINSDYSENPFEGLIYDVPITNITRGIEIDILQMVGVTETLKPIGSKDGILM